MGYTTDFDGKFEFNKPLDLETYRILEELAEERHDDGDFPSYYCQWIPTKDGKYLEWDENEKFYNYIQWLEYIIENILKPKGYILNGEVTWEGEESPDFGKIIIKNNVIETKQGKIKYD